MQFVINALSRSGECDVQSLTRLDLAANGFRARQIITGGTTNLTMHLDIASGAKVLKTPEANDSFSLATFSGRPVANPKRTWADRLWSAGQYHRAQDFVMVVASHPPP